MPPLLAIVLLEGVSLAQHGVDVEAFIDGAEVDQVLRGEVFLGVVGALSLPLVVNFTCESKYKTLARQSVKSKLKLKVNRVTHL